VAEPIKKTVHVTIDSDLLELVENYRRKAVGKPSLSGMVETALENLMECEGVVGKEVEE
jgi:hypothetical protein